jgi:hypothetical protein
MKRSTQPPASDAENAAHSASSVDSANSPTPAEASKEPNWAAWCRRWGMRLLIAAGLAVLWILLAAQPTQAMSR